jgi:hypothetical protein
MAFRETYALAATMTAFRLDRLHLDPALECRGFLAGSAENTGDLLTAQAVRPLFAVGGIISTSPSEGKPLPCPPPGYCLRCKYRPWRMAPSGYAVGCTGNTETSS